ncbi:hypothetical protein ACP275_12G164300 [Erythranthe tilingii]
MGCSFSCKRPSFSSSTSKKSNFEKVIRIVDLNGYTEEIDYPVTVGEVTGNPPKHFLFTHTQLLSSASTPLKSDTLLEQGRLYFLLPYSLFDSNVSPLDLAPIARKLSQSSRARKPKSRKQNIPSPNAGFSDTSGNKTDNNEVLRGPKSRSWKPVLATIRERSFNRRSESDLLEKCEG